MKCPFCEAVGRAWPVESFDAHCGLCGSPLRDVALSVEAASEASSAVRAAETLWLVPSGAGMAPEAPLTIRNVGPFDARVDAVDVEPAGLGRVVWEPRTLRPGSAAAATLQIHASTVTTTVDVTLVARGDVERRTALRLRPAPPLLLSRAAAHEQWGEPAVEPADAMADPTVHSGSAPPGGRAEWGPDGSGRGTLIWTLPELTLLPWSDGTARFEVLAAPARGWPGGTMPPVLAGSVKWESGDGGGGNRDGFGAEQEHPAGDGGGGGAGPARFVIRAGGLREETVGRVVFQLAAVGAPTVEVPVRLRPGRPEWTRDGGAAQDGTGALSLPAGYPSGIVVTFSPSANAAASDPALGARIRGYDLVVAPTDPSVRVRVQPVIAPAAAGLERLSYRVRIWPPAGAGPFELRLELRGRLERGSALLAAPARLRANAVAVVEAGANAGPGVAAGVRRRLVVDFGTTNSCVARADPDVSRDACLELPAITSAFRRGGGDRDMVPTVLWLRATATRDDPECLIGHPAELQGSAGGGGGRVFREFKPDVGRDKPELLAAAGPDARAWTYAPADLARFFLRELLLEVRATLGHQPVDSLYITCPSTFSAEQRAALEQVLGEVRRWGVTGEAAVLLDEANAGAFSDLRGRLENAPPPAGGAATPAPAPGRGTQQPELYAMIFDFGGGTIDVALIGARRKADDASQYELVPAGVTGLRDFAGKNVTQAIARKLEEKLHQFLYKDKKLMRLGAVGWLPLPGAQTLAGQPPPVLAAGEANQRFLLELAEWLKLHAYGSWGEPFEQGEEIRIPAGNEPWYAKLKPDLIAASLRDLDRNAVRTLPSRVASVGADLRTEPVQPDEWLGWLRELKLERREMDDEIGEAIDEAFGRARRLWESVGLPAPYRPPDLFLLAGGSSRLPVIWQSAEKVLGIRARDIQFNTRTAKRKVAQGAALYTRVRYLALSVGVTPENTLDYVLLPLVYERDARRFAPIFPVSTHVPPGGVAERVIRYPLPQRRLDLVVYESIDFRAEQWTPGERLQRLGMYAPGKQHIATFHLMFPDTQQTEVTHRLRTVRNGPRMMSLHYASDGGPAVAECPV